MCRKLFRILIADDDPDIRELLSEILQDEGFTAVVASDGKYALSIFNSAIEVSLVLSDVDMPNLNGTELLSRVRMDERKSHIPFFLMSAGQRKGIFKACDGFIEKPFEIEKVLKIVEHHYEDSPIKFLKV